jgi:polysaccharide biosynthesis/export protein
MRFCGYFIPRRAASAALCLLIFSGGLVSSAQGANAVPSTPAAEQAIFPGASSTDVASRAHAAESEAAAPAVAPAAAPQKGGTPAYRIGVDDVLSITVWHEPDLSRNVPVRPDGKISLPLVGEVQAAGSTTPELEKELRASLSKFLKDPELTVMVAEIRSQRVNIIGQVMHPGAFPLTQSMGVLDAIALAGGLRDFAKKGSIYVLREGSDGQRVRMKYNYKAVLQGKRDAQDIILRPNDTVVVP